MTVESLIKDEPREPTPTIATPIGVEPHDLTLIRPDDLLHLEFDFVNLRLDAGPNQPAKLVRVDPGQPALIVVRFPQQHLNERTFSKEQAVTPPVQARLSGPTRLAFRLLPGMNEIPYTVESLLDWKKFEPSLAPVALPPSANPATPPPIAEPSAVQTAIEMPYRLFLSPDSTATWEHATKPQDRNGTVELWHTRLRIAGQPNAKPSLRAIWSPDFPSASTPFPLGPLAPADRRQLVRLTSDFALAQLSGGQVPRPITADQFMLTPLGGYMRTRGAWNPPLNQGLTIAAWRHLATLGRDHSVRLTKVGFLLPFGHRAIKVEAIEREVFKGQSVNGVSRMVAALRKREFIVLVEAEKRYDDAIQSLYAAQGREMPLKSVRIQIGETPEIDSSDAIGTTGAFWVRVGTSDLLFPLAATDADGESVEFSAPMIFVPGDVAETNPIAMTQIRNAYAITSPNGDPRRTAPVSGQPIAYAPRATPSSDAARLVTERLIFNTQAAPLASTGGAPFLPLIERAKVRVAAVEALTGTSQAVDVEFFDKYLAGIIDGAQNRAAVFMRFIDAAKQPISLPVNLPTETVGGLASTALELTGLSRTLGTLPGDLKALAAGQFKPVEIFKGSSAKLLGVIDLKAIIKEAIGDQEFAAQIPKLISETKRLPNNIPESVVTKFDWNPTLKDVVPFKASLGGTPASMIVKTTIEQKLEPGAAPLYSVEGTLNNFQLDFGSVLTINFARLVFVSKSGQKTELKTQLDKVPMTMAGALRFLDKLREKLPPDLFGNLPKVDVTSRGLSLATSIALPPLAFGAFTLQNVILGGQLTLPFVDDPARVRFNFGTREQMFAVSVLAIGGGGFLGIEATMDRVVGIEAALEFGGTAALNLGIAKASVFAMAGFYFRYADVGQDPRVDFTGYIRYGGSATVLGLVTVGVEFYLGLTYRPEENVIQGQAAVTVKVRIAFFSKSKTLRVERSFKGLEALEDVALRALPGGGASFGDMLDESDWQEYAAAFV
jgi:hypothetical protein